MFSKQPEQKIEIPLYDKENKTLNGVPLWFLFIDKECQWRGEMGFDTGYRRGGATAPEPGYSAGLYAAFDYILTEPNKKMDDIEYKKIFHLAMDPVQSKETLKERINNVKCYYEDEYRCRNINFKAWNIDPTYAINAEYGIIMDIVSPAARLEWESEKLIAQNPKEEDKDYLAYLYLPTKGIISKSHPTKAPHVIKKIFEYYDDHIKNAKNDNEKLNIIVTACRRLEIGHFFWDGNQRTVVFILLNKWLLENGFTPVILNDPTIFDGYLSRDELVEQVKIGMKYYSSLVSVLNDDANKSFIMSHPYFKDLLTVALAILYPYPSLLKNEKIRSFLSMNAMHAGLFAEILVKLYEIVPALINEITFTLLIKHAINASGLLDFIDAFKTSSFVKTLNGEKLQLLLEHADQLPNIRVGLKKLNNFNADLLNKENIIFLSRLNDASKATNVAFMLFLMVYTQNNALITDENRNLLIQNAAYASDTYDAIVSLGRFNQTIFKSIMDHAEYAKKILKRLKYLKHFKVEFNKDEEFEYMMANFRYFKKITYKICHDRSNRSLPCSLETLLNRHSSGIEEITGKPHHTILAPSLNH